MGDGWLGLNPKNTDLGGKLLGHRDPHHRLIQAHCSSPPSWLPQVQASPGCLEMEGRKMCLPSKTEPCDAPASMWVIIPHNT